MIAALVLGRAETNPFPGRNIFPLLGRPMMAYPLLAARHAVEVSNVFLSTDDPQMTRIARFLGAEVIERPEEFRNSGVPLELILAQGYGEIVRRLGSTPEFLVVLLANAPTVTSGLINQAAAMMRRDASLDAVITVTMRNDFSPRYAMGLSKEGLLRPFPGTPPEGGDAYFRDALLWALRPRAFFEGKDSAVRANEIVNAAVQRVAPLVHEGYGDVDHLWQIPGVEDWLRRQGFSDEKTPYEGVRQAPSSDGAWKAEVLGVPPRQRVLVTTVPFSEGDPRPLQVLKGADARLVINPFGRKLKEKDLVELIPDFGILVAGTEPITERVMAAAPHLKLIARVGIGLDNVDLAAARRRGIQVTYTPEAPAPAVAELTVGLMLSLLRHIAVADRQMKNGVWNRLMGRRLSEMVVGVLGVGRVGRRLIEHLTGGFPGVRILANDLKPDREFGLAHGVTWVEKEEIYESCDVVSIHVPLTPQTRGMISARELVRFRPGALLVNTARGGILDERDLAQALREGRLGGAAVDVFEKEPYSGELATLPRCLLTCHMGSMSADCRGRMELEASEDAALFIQGRPLLRPVPEGEYVLNERKE